MPILDRSIPLSLAEILGSAMSSVIDAQAQSARASMEFIHDVGFQSPPPANGEEKLRTLLFRYSKLDENNQRAEFTVELPLLAIVDIPMVSVKSATFEFTYEITQSDPGQQDSTTSSGGTGFLSRLSAPAKLQGRVAKSSVSTQEKGNLSVKVELEKTAMPVGVEKILDVLELASSERKSAGSGTPS